MKISKVSINNRRKEFLIVTHSGMSYSYPYVEADPSPDSDNRIVQAFVDKELTSAA